MKIIDSVAALQQRYGDPSEAAVKKVTSEIIPVYQQWIKRSRFCVLTSVGPAGTDGSPRGDDDAVVRIIDKHTLALPDWKGNNRADSLLNIIHDGRVSLLFLIPGSNTVIRVNGTAVLSIDERLLQSFERDEKQPRSIILVTVAEVYFQCARALIRSGLWAGEDRSIGLPSPGSMLAEITNGEVDAAHYDASWSARASESMW